MKRFYKKAEVVPAAGGHGIALDGRLVKTPGKCDLVVPSSALATAIAAEWEAQQSEIRRETSTVRTKIAIAASTAKGANLTKAPSAVATPLPPRNPSHIGNICPMIANSAEAAISR